MRIGLNALAAVPTTSGGAARYLRNLVENLARIDKSNEYVLFVAPCNKDLFRVKQANFEQVVCSISPRFLPMRVLYEQVILPILMWRCKIDILHSPASVSPFVLPCPSVVTIHDVTPFVFPELTPLIPRHYWNIAFRRSARLARLIITGSYSTRKDLVRFLGISEERIEVVYHGGGLNMPKSEDKSCLRSTENKGKSSAPYILWVGRMYGHKNLIRLLYAYNKLMTDHPGIKHQLVLCGTKSWGYHPLVRMMEDLNLQDRVILRGYVPADELKSMYTRASLLVFPSLAEGFGFPILEAMSCGTPVVTSNYGAMAEIAGDAAVLVSPYSVDEIAEAMHRALTDETLRGTLVEKGFRRASEFSWEKTARETLAVYEAVCGKG